MNKITNTILKKLNLNPFRFYANLILDTYTKLADYPESNQKERFPAFWGEELFPLALINLLSKINYFPSFSGNFWINVFNGFPICFNGKHLSPLDLLVALELDHVVHSELNPFHERGDHDQKIWS